MDGKFRSTIYIFFILFITSNINFISYCMLGNKIENETKDNKEYKNKSGDEEDKKINELFSEKGMMKNNKDDDEIYEFSDSEDIISSMDDMLENKREEEEKEEKNVNYIVIIEGKKKYYYKCIEKHQDYQDYDEDYVITSFDDFRKNNSEE